MIDVMKLERCVGAGTPDTRRAHAVRVAGVPSPVGPSAHIYVCGPGRGSPSEYFSALVARPSSFYTFLVYFPPYKYFIYVKYRRAGSELTARARWDLEHTPGGRLSHTARPSPRHPPRRIRLGVSKPAALHGSHGAVVVSNGPRVRAARRRGSRLEDRGTGSTAYRYRPVRYRYRHRYR